MSKEQAREFIDRLDRDEDFKKEVTNCKNSEERIQFIKSQGFDFTTDEIKEVTEELSEQDLERISGGIPPGDPRGNPREDCGEGALNTFLWIISGYV
ncbi:MAG: Nif11-like leader peptide family natural product precursor [Desulfovermiculus sp.]